MWSAAALLLPGLGLELTLARAAPGLFVRVVRSFLLTLAFWPLAIFLTRLPFVSLGVLVGLGLAFGVVTVGIHAQSFADELRKGKDAVPALAFLALACAHLYPITDWLVAPGADMSMHTFMTRLIVENGRLPTSYEPIFPIHDFGSYAAGLPALAASATTLSGAPVERTTLAAALLAYPALVGGLALVAVRFASAGASFVAATLVVCTCEMHAYLLWGGSPTILSFALVFAAISCFALPSRGDHERFFPLLAAGAGLVHIIPVLGMAYAFPLTLGLWLFVLPEARRNARLRAWLPRVGLAIAFLSLPFLFGARPVVSQHEVDWVMRWQRDAWHSYTDGTWENFTRTIWPFLEKHFSDGRFVLGAALLALPFSRGRRLWAWLPFAAIVLLLVLNSRYWVLPASPALYPERMLVLLLAPGCVGLAVLFETLVRPMRRWPVALRAVVIAFLLWPLARWSDERAELAIGRAGERITVTKDDVAMTKWIHASLPADAVIANNYGDAGAWLPALAFRAVTHPHTNPFYFDEIDAWRMEVPARYLYIGAHRYYTDMQYEGDLVRRQPFEYVELHAEGDARIYAIVHPHPARPTDTWMGR